MFETSEINPREALKATLSKLVTERENFARLITESGENINAELGSEAYKDFGYTVQLEETDLKIKEIEAKLKDEDDKASIQRNLNI